MSQLRTDSLTSGAERNYRPADAGRYPCRGSGRLESLDGATSSVRRHANGRAVVILTNFDQVWSKQLLNNCNVGQRVLGQRSGSKLAARAQDHRVLPLGDRPRRTWEEAVVQWLEDRKHKKDYRNDVTKSRWLTPLLRGTYLDEIDWEVLDRIAKVKEGEGVAPATVNRYLALISAILRRAKTVWKWVDDVPATPTRAESEPIVRFLTPDQADRLIDELPLHLAEMARFAVATGLRAGNVVGIKWAQVDVARRLAWVNSDGSKNRKAIGVPLNAGALAVLDGQRGNLSESVFTCLGRPLKRCSTKAWYRTLERVGFDEPFRWHDWRHTWASWHAQSGTPQSVLQALGGWSSPEMVNRYAHLSTEHLAQYVENSSMNRTKSGTVESESDLEAVQLLD
jgi:integrase